MTTPIDTLLRRGLVSQTQHHLLGTTRAFLEFAGLSDLADLPLLVGSRDEELEASTTLLDV